MRPARSILPHVGERVVLRRLARADLPAFQTYRHDPDVGRYQGWVPQTDADALAFIERMAALPLFLRGVWVQIGIADPETDLLIGDIGMCLSADGDSAEIGFTMSAAWQGHGLGTEAVRAAVQLLFERTAVAKVVGITDARNVPSIRLLERLGMRRIATHGTVFRGAPCIEHTYALERATAGPRPAD